MEKRRGEVIGLPLSESKGYVLLEVVRAVVPVEESRLFVVVQSINQTILSKTGMGCTIGNPF